MQGSNRSASSHSSHHSKGNKSSNKHSAHATTSARAPQGQGPTMHSSSKHVFAPAPAQGNFQGQPNSGQGNFRGQPGFAGGGWNSQPAGNPAGNPADLDVPPGAQSGECWMDP